MLTHNTSRMVSLAALIMLIMVTTASGQSRTPCPPKDDKLYTANETHVKALIDKLEPFERDMRGLLQDLKGLKAEDNTNRIVGKVFGYKEVLRQSNKALCASANAASAIGPNKVTNLKLYASACRLGDDVGEGINDLIDCARGNCLGLASQFPKARKGRGSGGESLRQAELQEKAAKIADKINDGVKSGQDGDKPGLFGAACGAAGTGLKTPLGKSVEAAEKFCAAAVAAAKAKATLETVEALDSASEENQSRLAQQIQVLETKVSAVSEKINRLRADVYAIDWGTMGKPEPNMTPIKQPECDDSKNKDDELDRLAKDGLGEMDRVRQDAAVRPPVQPVPQIDGVALLGEILTQANVLKQHNSSLKAKNSGGSNLALDGQCDDTNEAREAEAIAKQVEMASRSMGIAQQQCALAQAHVRIGHLQMRAANRCNMHVIEAKAYLDHVQREEGRLCNGNTLSLPSLNGAPGQSSSRGASRPAPRGGGYSGPPPPSVR